MHDALASEALVELLVIGDVVLMRQEHPADAAHRVDPLHERSGEARRVDQDVAAVAPDEIAERAER